MSSINWESILKKAQAHMKTTGAKKQVDEIMSDFVLGKIKLSSLSGVSSQFSPNEAADMFIKILREKIYSHAIGETFTTAEGGGLGKTALDALDDIVHDKPTPIKGRGSTYEVKIRFAGERHRESLMPERYDGVDNIIALLNTGYQAGRSVKGIWRGHTDEPIYSLPHRQGAFFIQEAKKEFMELYAPKYGVISIDIDADYE